MQILNTQEATGDLVTETIHGTKVGDAFRWLEDHSSSRIHNWLEKQAEISYAYFDGLESRNNIRQRIAELVATSSAEAPWNVGNHYYYLKRQDGREQPIIVRRNGLFGEQSVLVDPYLRHAGDTASVAIAAISPDDRFLAYSVRDGGTDYSSKGTVFCLTDYHRDSAPVWFLPATVRASFTPTANFKMRDPITKQFFGTDLALRFQKMTKYFAQGRRRMFL